MGSTSWEVWEAGHVWELARALGWDWGEFSFAVNSAVVLGVLLGTWGVLAESVHQLHRGGGGRTA